MKHRNRKQAVASARKQRRAANRRANRTSERIDGRVTGKTSDAARNRRQRRAIEAQAETYTHPHNVRIADEITARLVRAETKRQPVQIIAAPVAELPHFEVDIPALTKEARRQRIREILAAGAAPANTLSNWGGYQHVRST